MSEHLTNDHLAKLIQAVEDSSSAAQLTQAIQNLAAARSEKALPILLASLSYNNPGAAVAAVDGLIQLGEPAVPALLEQLDQQNYTARSWAIRALAGIGDPRGLICLLGAATADFSMSVRRAAARGLGVMKWHWFPPELLEIAQEEALDALLFVAQQDEEWVVRYSAVVGLQSLALAIVKVHPEWRTEIETRLTYIGANDTSAAVQARVWMAQKTLHSGVTPIALTADLNHSSPLSAPDWQQIMEKLYERKGQERLELPEGDPRRYRGLVVAVLPEQAVGEV